VTSFLPDHPGGVAVILKQAGRDATYDETQILFCEISLISLFRKTFIPLHPPGTLSMLDPQNHIGPVDPATLPQESEGTTDEERRIQDARAALPPPDAALNLHDIEVGLTLVLMHLRLMNCTASRYWRNQF
jgi:L-lactate dehydrogenase (cytochrome)